MKTGGPTWAVSQKTGSYFSSKIITNHLKTSIEPSKDIQKHLRTLTKKQSKNIEKKHLWKATSDPLTPFKIPDLPVPFVQDTPLAPGSQWVNRTGWSREGWHHLLMHKSPEYMEVLVCTCISIYLYRYVMYLFVTLSIFISIVVSSIFLTLQMYIYIHMLI